MNTDKNKRERTVQPCNFRSAGRLSNESARALKTLHESLARNLMNTLDVYLGTSLEIKLYAGTGRAHVAAVDGRGSAKHHD